MCWPEWGWARPAPSLPGPVWSCQAVFGSLEPPSLCLLPWALVLGTRQEVAWFLHSGGQVTRGVAESLMTQPALLLLGRLQRQRGAWQKNALRPHPNWGWKLSGLKVWLNSAGGLAHHARRLLLPVAWALPGSEHAQ